MEEKEIIDGWDITPEDNSNVSDKETPDTKDNSQDNEENLETYKKRYSDSSREAKRITQVSKAYRQVLKDNSHLLELAPEIAKDVVTQLFEDWFADTDSVDELLEAIKSWKWQAKSGDSVNKDEIYKEVRARLLEEKQEEEANSIIETALESFSPELKKEMKADFKDVLWNRKLTPDFAKKEIEKIVLYYNRDSIRKQRNDEALSNMASGWLGKWKSVEWSTSMTIEKLDSLWMPKATQRQRYPELFPKN